MRQTIDASKRIVGPAHPLVLIAMAELGVMLDCEGRNFTAAKVEREALAGLSNTPGPQQPETTESLLNLAAILMHQQHFVEAEQLARQAHDVSLRALGRTIRTGRRNQHSRTHRRSSGTSGCVILFAPRVN